MNLVSLHLYLILVTIIWTEHFLLDDITLKGKTAIGRVTVKVLVMNHDTQLNVRKTLIKAGKYKV